MGKGCEMLSSRNDINTAIMIPLQLWHPALGLHKRVCQQSKMNWGRAHQALPLPDELLTTNTLQGMGEEVIVWSVMLPLVSPLGSVGSLETRGHTAGFMQWVTKQKQRERDAAWTRKEI